MNLNIKEIPSLEEVMKQTIKFKPDNWLSNKTQKNEKVFDDEIFPIVQKVCGMFKCDIDKNESTISREQIIDFIKQPDSDPLQIFILVMIWGHGEKENRGPWKVGQMLDKPKDAKSILENSFKAIKEEKTNEGEIKEEKIKKAHIAFKEMKRCRVNFFSKFLYFVGKANNVKNYPLIFDARVAENLIKLHMKEIDPEVAELVTYQPQQDADSYAKYCKLMHKIAADNKIEADQLEYYLFSKNFD